MNKTTKLALLFLVLGVIVVLIIFKVTPMLFEKKQRQTSDAQVAQTAINMAGDNYLGYWFFTSPEMRKLCSRQGLQINFTDDGGVYAERLEKFNNGDYDAIVLPIAEYIKHGAQYSYPGVIAMSISESRGADGIVAFKSSLSTGEVTDLNDNMLQFVFTAESPTSFLIDLIITDFDFFNLKNNQGWQVPVNSSREVLKKLQDGEGDVFGLWEPDLSKALKNPNVVYVWGSDKFSNYIIDVVVFRRDYLDKHKQEVMKLFQAYFRIMTQYSRDPDKMIKEMTKSTDLEKSEIKEILAKKKIEWFDLQENCALQFGINTSNDAGALTNEGVINTIIACTDVLLKTGKFSSDPLGNPYLITNSKIMEELAQTTPASLGAGAAKITFSTLSDVEWEGLKEVSSLSLEHIEFQSWNSLLQPHSKETVDKIAQTLVNNYPLYRVVVRGHTGPGDEQENLKTSLERAESVMQYMVAVHDIDPNRLKSEGLGHSQPLRRPDVNPRKLRYMQSRVEFVLLEENIL